MFLVKFQTVSGRVSYCSRSFPSREDAQQHIRDLRLWEPRIKAKVEGFEVVGRAPMRREVSR